MGNVSTIILDKPCVDTRDSDNAFVVKPRYGATDNIISASTNIVLFDEELDFNKGRFRNFTTPRVVGNCSRIETPPRPHDGSNWHQFITPLFEEMFSLDCLWSYMVKCVVSANRRNIISDIFFIEDEQCAMMIKLKVT